MRESNMDDLACLKVIGILAVNFMFSVTVSNYLTDEIGLIKSSTTSLKIFSSSYFFGYFILLFANVQNFASVLPHMRAKGNFILTSILKWFIGALAFHCLAVLYGAALFRNVEETFMWSVMMSNIVILPSLVTEVDEIFMVLHGKRRAINLPSCICGIMVLTLLGAWVGAFTLPLDWDREWQVWPIPCAIGAMTGHFVSLLLSVMLLLWKYRNRNKTDKFI